MRKPCLDEPSRSLKADASHAGVRKQGGDGPVATRSSDHLSDLAVELGESTAYL